jgi:hypothetical protein
MSVQFAGQSYFSSGPHVLLFGRMGRYVSAPYPQGGYPTSTDFGPRERKLQVKGRLVGNTVSVLMARLNTIRDLAEASTVGTLQWEGQSWTGMRLVDLELLGPIERGRVCSVAYVVTFLNF